MPIRKTRLSPREQRGYFIVAQQLQQDGLPIDIPEEWTRQSQQLEISVCPVSTLHVLRPGLTVYAPYVRLTSMRSNLVVKDLDFNSAWDNGIVACSAEAGCYLFAQTLKFEFDEVLNHQLQEPFCFRYVGDHLEGWLLGHGLRPVPPEYANNRLAPFTLSFLDQFGETHSTNALAIVSRSARFHEVRLQPRSLYDRPASLFASEAGADATASAPSDGNNSSRTTKDQFRAGTKVKISTVHLRRERVGIDFRQEKEG